MHTDIIGLVSFVFSAVTKNNLVEDGFILACSLRGIQPFKSGKAE